MTIKQILKQSPLPRAETRDLLCLILKKEPAFILAHPEYRLTSAQAHKLASMVKFRQQGYPLAYLLKSQPFGELSFFVDKRVLIPRPETELLVDEAIRIIAHSTSLITVADVGTGSGNIAITLAHHFRRVPHRLHILATDTSADALAVAKKNAKLCKLDRHLTFLKGNLLAPVFKHLPHPKHLLIVANLPYLSEKLYRANPELAFEPKISLHGGRDGLDLYRELLKQLTNWQAGGAATGTPQGRSHSEHLRGESRDRTRSISLITLLLEISPEQKASIKKLIKSYFPKAKLEIKKDLAGRPRMVLCSMQVNPVNKALFT